MTDGRLAPEEGLQAGGHPDRLEVDESGSTSLIQLYHLPPRLQRVSCCMALPAGMMPGSFRGVLGRGESGESMDLSKLPRLSNTERPAPSAEPTPEGPSPAAPRTDAVPVVDYRYPGVRPVATGRGPEAWISIGVGLIFLFVFPHFTQWWIHTVFHTKTVPSFLPITDSQTGAEIPYSKSDFFFNDLAIAFFAYALIVEGVALVLAGRNRPGVVMFAFVVTAAAVALNAWYLVSSFGEGFPVVSAIAIVLGGYMLWFQWNLARELRAVRRAELAAAAARAAAGA